MGEFDPRRKRPFRPSIDGGGIPRKTVEGLVSLFTKESTTPETVSSLNVEYFIQEENKWRLNLSELQWHSLEEDAQDHVRYELERRKDIDWPSWIPREDARGSIRSRRGMMDNAFGQSTRTEVDSRLDEGRIQEERDRSFPPIDPAAGADKP